MNFLVNGEPTQTKRVDWWIGNSFFCSNKNLYLFRLVESIWIRTDVSDRKIEETQTGLDTSFFLPLFLVAILFNETI